MRKRAKTVATQTVTQAARRIQAAVRAAQGRRRAIPRFRAGFSRTGGFYGRFQPGGPEIKFKDIAIAAAVPGFSGTILSNCLNVIPQDDTESGRIGRKITISGIYLHGEVTLAGTTTTTQTCDEVRYIVYLDKQANGAAATAANIMASEPAPGAGAVTIDSYRNLENVARFQIIFDKKFAVNQQVAVAAAPAVAITSGLVFKSFSFAKKCNIQIDYDSSAATGALTTVRSNNLGVLAISRRGIASTEFNCRLRYKDM